MAYESDAQPIKLGYLMDFVLPDEYPEDRRLDLTQSLVPVTRLIRIPSFVGQSRQLPNRDEVRSVQLQHPAKRLEGLAHPPHVAQRSRPNDMAAGVVWVAKQPFLENRERLLGLSSLTIGIGEASKDEAFRLTSILLLETPDLFAGRRMKNSLWRLWKYMRTKNS